MARTTIAFLVSLVTMAVLVYAQNDDQNCPPEWSVVHQCWKSFELRYKNFNNNTAISMRQQAVQDMCLCMSKAVGQVSVTNDLVEIRA